MSTPSAPSSPPAPDLIGEAARAVAESLTALTGHQITFKSWQPYPEYPQQCIVAFEASGQPVSVFAMDDSVGGAAMAMLNSLTDVLSEHYWAEPIPPCPGHAHPMRPVCNEHDVVTWECPADHRTVAQLWPPHG
jgi:hypothetical protein